MKEIQRRILALAALPVMSMLLLGPALADDAEPTFEQEFDTFLAEQEAEFQRFADESDAEFSEWLDQAWQSFRQSPPQHRDLGPKIPLQPLAPNSQRPEPSAATGAKPYTAPPTDRPDAELGFSFFGHPVAAPEWSASLPSLEKLDPRAVSDAWRSLSQVSYQPVLDALRNTCLRLKCGDWAQILLVREYGDWLSARHGADTSQRALLEWFLLDKLGYRVRGGRFVDAVEGKPKLTALYRPKQEVYGASYFSIAGEEYFPTRSLPRGKLFSYPAGFEPSVAHSRRAVDLAFSRTLQVLPRNVAVRKLEWPLDPARTITLKYDDSRRRYLDEHPQLDLKWYFLAPLDPILAESAERALKQDLEELTALQQANRLLHFVQFALPYELDESQFGRENYLMPEQVLHYPASDCEDRSLLYVGLVRRLLDIPAVGVRYPGHVAAALRLTDVQPTDAVGNFYSYGGHTYHLADPSYLGAGVGELMGQLHQHQGQLILP